MKTVLCVRPNGIITGLYTEIIDLAELGRLTIQRASSIEFDNPCQLWRVFDRKGECIHASVSRLDCLNWEADYFSDRKEP
jgi:hypothetical protein